MPDSIDIQLKKGVLGLCVLALLARDDSYAYTTPRGPTAQNYRQKFGRGLDARYYAFGLAGAGDMEIDDLDIEVVMRANRRV